MEDTRDIILSHKLLFIETINNCIQRYNLEESAALLLAGAGVLLEQLEGSLARLVALAGQVLKSLLASHHLLAANNATMLVLDKVLLLETTGRVLGRAMEHLGLGTSRHFKLGHLILVAAILSAGEAGLDTKMTRCVGEDNC